MKGEPEIRPCVCGEPAFVKRWLPSTCWADQSKGYRVACRRMDVRGQRACAPGPFALTRDAAIAAWEVWRAEATGE